MKIKTLVFVAVLFTACSSDLPVTGPVNAGAPTQEVDGGSIAATDVAQQPNVCKCDDGNECTSDTCKSGKCEQKFVDGDLCNDGNPCTNYAECKDGVCLGWNAEKGYVIPCDDGNACTWDNCHPIEGCSHSVLSCSDLDPCTVDSCDPSSGCLNQLVPGCTVCNKAEDCNDNNPCTSDTCAIPVGDQFSSCTHAPVDCNDNNSCTVDACDPAVGCTVTDVNCDDGSACTFDYCHVQIGCGHVTDTVCIDCKVDADCPEVTKDSECLDGSNITANVFTGKCMYSQCVWFPLTKSCDDKSLCTADTCEKGKCTYTPIDCDDKDSATMDSCNAQTGKCANVYPWGLKLELLIDPKIEEKFTTYVYLEWNFKKMGKWADYTLSEKWYDWDKTNTVTLWRFYPGPSTDSLMHNNMCAMYQFMGADNPAPVVFHARRKDKADPFNVLKSVSLGGANIKATFVLKPFTAEEKAFPLKTQPAPMLPGYGKGVQDLNFYEAPELKELCKPFM